MADIALRFHKDMLVLSAPVEAALARLGVDTTADLEFTLLFEPDTMEQPYRMESLAGAQCLVAPTARLTPARLARVRMEDQAEALARTALAVLAPFRPQHVLVELAPCGLPLDPSAKASLVEHRDQYARAARLFDGAVFDGFLLSGFADCTSLKCALMGIAKVSDAPVAACVRVDGDGMLEGGRGETLEEAARVAEELGAAVVGFETAAGPDAAAGLVRRACAATSLPLPVLAALEVRPEGPYAHADRLADAAMALRAAGAQFLRATGQATAACTGAIPAPTSSAATTMERCKPWWMRCSTAWKRRRRRCLRRPAHSSPPRPTARPAPPATPRPLLPAASPSIPRACWA